ncbi:hypothetical protein LTR27_000408 [Elasticomyces elasticus]|nr:hypothetical protein LTR27_000408 [Elasticomyces elasticus]
MTGQSDKNSGLTPELSLGSPTHARAAAQAVCDNHDMPAPPEASNSQPAIPLIASTGRVACAVCRSRRVRCSLKFIPCTECRKRKISCAHRVTTGSENTASLLSSLSLESKDGSVSSSTGAQEGSTLLPDAGSSEPRFPAGDSRVEMKRGPLMRRRTKYVPRDSEGTLYLEEDPPISDDENPCAMKEVDRLLDSVTKQQKGKRTVKQDQPMLYVYLGPGAGQEDDTEKPLRLQDMIRRQVDQDESEIQQACCGSPTAATEQVVKGAQQEEKSKDTVSVHDNLVWINSEEGYDLVTGSAHRRHIHRM